MGDGIFAVAEGTASAISISNSGDVDASAGKFFSGDAIYALTLGRNSPIAIVNAGNITGEDDGIDARAVGAGSDITIVNTGSISASSLLAIDTYGASALLYNTGRITGFVDLTDQPDTFINQADGVFETKLTSDFGGGGDLFRNEAGGTVLAASNRNASETSAFVNLERFENSGLISMVDGRVGDVFEMQTASLGFPSALDANTLGRLPLRELQWRRLHRTSGDHRRLMVRHRRLHQ